MIAALSIAAFIAIFAMPLVPGLLELRRPRDDRALPIALAYTRDPRFFSRSFRAKIEPFLNANRHGKRRFLDRRNERANVGETIFVASRDCPMEAQIAHERLFCGTGATITDGYGRRSVRCDERVLARTLCTDGDLVLREGCAVERWLDAETSLEVERSCSLGTSASSGGTVRLAGNVTFERIFGACIVVRGASSLPAPRPDEAAIVLSRIDEGRDVIVRGDAIVPDDAVVDASIKVHGSLFIGARARITGNAVARKDLVLNDGGIIAGHAFCEERLFVGPGARIGTPGEQKTAYTAGTCLLCDGATVYGWVVSEQGGRSA